MSTTLNKAREYVVELLSRRQKQEQNEAAEEMQQHIESRDQLRVELEAAKESNSAILAQRQKDMKQHKKIGEQYRNCPTDFANSARRCELHREHVRLNRTVNSPLRLRDIESIENQLVMACRDSDLQAQFSVASDTLNAAESELTEADERRSEVWQKVSDARRGRLETLGNISNQFGREGQRWVRVEHADGTITVRSTKNGRDDSIHESNIRHINSALSRTNRIIRDGKTEVFEVDELTNRRDELQKQLQDIRQEMVESEI